MGIVVCAFMLLGLLIASPWVPAWMRPFRAKPGVAVALAWGLLLSGAWNFLWYGLRHVPEFWGLAAFVSGIVMIAVAALILDDRVDPFTKRHPLLRRTSAWLRALTMPLLAMLAVCFVLYATALVRLNLGLPIPG